MRTSELENLKVAIVGGGYGGAVAAVALSRLGATVSVYEQAAAIRQVGAGIGLRPPTIELFRELDIFDAIAAVSTPSDYFEILTATGEVIQREEWPKMHDYAQVNKTRFIHRGDFIDTLLALLPEGMVHLDHRLTEIEDSGSSATLTFAGGATVTADLVIGADGIRSTVRNQLFSDNQPVFAGAHAYRAVIDSVDTDGLDVDDNLRLYMNERGTMVYFLPLRHRDQVSFDITALSADDSWAPEVTTDELVALLDGFDERLVNITRNLDLDTVTSRAVFDIDPVDRWHSDCVTLLGDSAHAMLHHQGQGANQAIQDAGGLADALREADSVAEALALYQSTRKPVTDTLQRLSRESWDAESVSTAFPEKSSIT
ncbi:FAD-dependent oxidoreductase [Saccharomonospora azurea]|uniref:FAD-dependent oxidoreductase n=1 Tax=Saccharomonospora azurea TaxID=40988 RepID=UPI00024007F2|nr:FAD-dependent monooxygenase [Saccharomonospora azurea]EHK88057.1 monooxygenase FAD-binding protein [Saccharomonospora azurea SZMC 14600]